MWRVFRFVLRPISRADAATTRSHSCLFAPRPVPIPRLLISVEVKSHAMVARRYRASVLFRPCRHPEEPKNYSSPLAIKRPREGNGQISPADGIPRSCALLLLDISHRFLTNLPLPAR